MEFTTGQLEDGGTCTTTTADPAVLERSGSGGIRNKVFVNPCQRGNALLQHIKAVPWEYNDIIGDYQVGMTTSVLFLRFLMPTSGIHDLGISYVYVLASFKYHRLKPEYIAERVKGFRSQFSLRILLCIVDIEDAQPVIRELTQYASMMSFTIFLAWSVEEGARYIELLKAQEGKPPDTIKERVDGDYSSKVTDCFTSIKSVNKTDVMTLSSRFGSVKDIVNATPEEISACPGFGPQKVARLMESMQMNFIQGNKN